MLAFAALAFVAFQDGRMDVPPPRPVAAELARTFAGAIRRTAAFGPATGREVQPAMQGFTAPEMPFPAWFVEFQWKEKGSLRPGFAMFFDIVAAEKVDPGLKKVPRALIEGQWFAAQVTEGQTFAAWAEDTQVQRRDNNESMTQGDLRMVITAEAVFMSESGGSYGEIGCLREPASCLPGSKAEVLLKSDWGPADEHGYRRTFHAGPAAKGKAGQTGLIAGWAYTAVPLDPKFGRRAFCADSIVNDVCAVAGATMPALVGGRCPKGCQPSR